MSHIRAAFSNRHLLAAFLVVGSVLTVLDVTFLVKDGVPSGSLHDPAPLTVSLIISAALLCLLPLTSNYLAGDDPLNPLAVIGGVFFLYFPLSALAITVFESPGSYPAVRYNVDILLGHLTVGLALVNVGLIAMYLGYHVARDVPIPGPVIGHHHGWHPGIITGLWVIGLGAFYIYASSSVRSTPSIQLLSSWMAYGPAIFYYLALQRPETARWFVLFIAATACALASILLIGFDIFALLKFLFPLVVIYHYAGPGIGYRTIPKLAAGFLALFPIELLAQYLHTGESQAPALEHFATRMIGTESVTMVVHRVPASLPYEYGSTIMLAVYSLVPRALWSGKPTVNIGRRVAYEFVGRPEGVYVGRITLPAEFYWNFGSVGLVAGMFVYGVSIGVVYYWFRTRWNAGHRGVVTLLFYSIAFFHLVELEGSVAETYANMVKELAFAYLFIMLADGRLSHVFRRLDRASETIR
jgi:hypothetical protein